jgi:hypothetical protein
MWCFFFTFSSKVTCIGFWQNYICKLNFSGGKR